MVRWSARMFAICLAIGGAGTAGAADQPLWGDTHLHTSYSFDAYMLGNTTVDPAAAYRFAKGLPVLHPYSKTWARLERPLDFLAVADHAEMLGISRSLALGDPRMIQEVTGRSIYDAFREGRIKDAFQIMLKLVLSNDQRLANREVMQDNWNAEVDAADAANDPGKFTSLVGWEWSAMKEGGNLHRVVLTDAGGSVAKSFLPFSSNDSNRPEDLWSWLDRTQQRTHAEFLAIPHNSNVSKGFMFGVVDSDGRPLTAEYARIRSRWEPIVEITQTKGTSETNPLLSPNDEFASYEIVRKLLTSSDDATMTPADYVRSALRQGLEVEARTGGNPYKFGFVGSTDIHNGLSTAEESRFMGVNQASPEQGGTPHIKGSNTPWDDAASGRAAVWAESNTRAAIIAALRRREVYGTTGPRMTVRFFAGFGFEARDADARDIAAVGYRKGLPMGADITHGPKGRGLSFLVYAAKDPESGNLDRVQVVKGWVDRNGKSHEKIFDVAWSGKRRIGADGKLPPVGNTVDAATGRFTNSIGATELATVWRDPEFDPAVKAFYYLRVLEIPTPRQSLFDALALGIDPAKTGRPAWIQERAFSSPIWYAPS